MGRRKRSLPLLNRRPPWAQRHASRSEAPGEFVFASPIGRTVFFGSEMTALIELIHRYQTATKLEERIRAADDIMDSVATPLRLYIAARMEKAGVNDICQETLKGLFTSLDSFHGASDSQAWAWCHTIARHKLADHFRARGRNRLDFVDPDDLWEAIQARS